MDHNVKCQLEGCEMRNCTINKRENSSNQRYISVFCLLLTKAKRHLLWEECGVKSVYLPDKIITDVIKYSWIQKIWINKLPVDVLSWLTFHFKGLIINLAVSQPTNHHYEHFRQMSVNGNPCLTDRVFDWWWKIISGPANLRGLGTISLLRLHFWESVWFSDEGICSIFGRNVKKKTKKDLLWRDVSDRCY